MKNVLLLVHDDSGQEARLQAALDLVRAIEGHLTCLDVVQVPFLVGADYAMADAQVAVLELEREREAENRRRVGTRLAGEQLPWDWIDATGDIAPVLESQSGLADIIVLNTALSDSESPNMPSTVSDVVLQSGKPILAAPENARGFDACGHVLIAWNGSPTIAATIRAITPLLALAETATLVQIGEVADSSAEEAAAYLSRHRVHARIERLDPGQGTVAERIIGLCKDRRPGYCVIGAYGHSRVRETLFGGVTRTMLMESPVPLILGH